MSNTNDIAWHHRHTIREVKTHVTKITDGNMLSYVVSLYRKVHSPPYCCASKSRLMPMLELSSSRLVCNMTTSSLRE